MGKKQHHKRRPPRAREGRWKASLPEAQKMGRSLEWEVGQALKRMVTEGRINDYQYHQPHSREDKEGKDFTATRKGEARSFGVSTSYFHAKDSEARHGVRVLHVSKRAQTHLLVAGFVEGLFADQETT